MKEFSLVRGRNALLVWSVVLLVVLLTSLPYWFAWNSGEPGYEFAGALANPIDGQSYLAKMRQGWEGEWRFRLPFTAEAGDGAYLFTFYLALGHLARLFALPLSLVYQIARIAASIVMLLSLASCLQAWLAPGRERNYAFILAAFGGGLGWLLLPLDGFTADFWLAEAYPFLSAYTNPHFPLTIAIILLFVTPPDRIRLYGLGSLAAGIVLGIISPFAVLVCLGILGAMTCLNFIRSREVSWPLVRFVWLLLGGGLVVGYALAAIRGDPVLAGWNSQNLTPTPPLGELLISFSPALLLAGAGLWASRNRIKRIAVPFLVWVLLVLAVIYLPINLQRRILVGFYVPVVALASMGLTRIAGPSSRKFISIGALVFLFSIPTPLLVLMAGIQGAQTRDPLLFITRPEAEAFLWIQANTDPDSLVLSGPETGLFLPGQTGRRVIYGHPFETVDAPAEQESVEAFFSGEIPIDEAMEFLSDRRVDFIFFGPRERMLGNPEFLSTLEIPFENDAVTIYAAGRS